MFVENNELNGVMFHYKKLLCQIFQNRKNYKTRFEKLSG